MTIAIIEDETAHQNILASYIEAWSRTAKQTVSIRCYQDAGQFLFAWEDEQPDVVFVDIQMPGMNGIELAKRLRTQDQELVIIFTTGLADYMEEGYEVEALHYLLKPIRREREPPVWKRLPENGRRGSIVWCIRRTASLGRFR